MIGGVFFCLLLQSPRLLAQNAADSSAWVFGAKAHYGFILVHSPDVSNVEGARPWGIEATALKKLGNAKTWNNCQCYPRIGASLVYFNYDSPDELGQGVTLYTFAEPVINARSKLSLGIRGGAGISYLDRPYDAETNPGNQSYSTYFNFFLYVGTTLYYQISPEWGVNLGGHYNHHSNGGIQNPNKGINFPTASLGVEYTPHPIMLANRTKKSLTGPKKRRLDLSIFATQKAISTQDDTKFPIYGAMVQHSWQVTRLSALTAGAVWEVDEHLEEKQERENGTVDGYHKGSLLAGHEFLLGRFQFSQALGFHVYEPSRTSDLIYHRWGFSMHVTPRWFAEVALKAERHVAQFVSVRLGYSLHR